MDVGSELRQARERQGLSLQQISNTTKISLRVLQAIEAADAARLTAPVFTRSFVRSYAAQVGLDPDDTSRRYLEQLAPPEAPEPAQPLRRPGEHPLARLLKGRFGTASVLILVGLAAFLLAVRNARHERSDGAAPPAAAVVSAAGSVPPGTAPPSPVATSGTTGAPPRTLHLTITPTAPCWVQATVAGQSVLGKLLGAGDRRDIDVPADVTLRVGDPKAFAFTINGMPAKVPGPAGQAVTVQITKENYRTFLSR